MEEITKHPHGTFCWLDLATTDPAAGKKFYSDLMGWEAMDTPAGEGMTYTMLMSQGKAVAALFAMDPKEIDQGMPSRWTSYIAVDNVDEIAGKVKELGGTLLMDPFDVMEDGRMVIIQDPTGAHVAFWQAKKTIGMALKNVVGATCWFELATKDTAKAKAFYTQLLGWKVETADMGGTEYTSYMQDEQPVAGMYAITPEMGDAPSHWLAYLALEDCDAAVAMTEKAGGKIMAPARDMPEVGRFAVIQDPQGAAVGIIQMAG